MSVQSLPSTLTDYAAIRQELMADLEQMATLLRVDAQADDGLSQSILEKVDRRLKKLEDDRLTIGIFGETCSGKSTLINTLSRREVTRPDVLSNTGVIMEFEYGEQEDLHVRFKDGRVEPTDWESVVNYTDQLENPENEKGVSRVSIRLPMPYLKNGIRFYDTPGLNDVIQEYTDLSQRFLEDMGAVIITSLYPPFTRGELDFLKRASHQCDKLFVIVNLSTDYWSQRERLKKRVIANITRDPDLRSHPDLQQDKLRIYVLNAREAWQAVENKDTAALDESGFGAFQKDLESFLTQDASRAVLASSIRSSFEVITLLQKLLTLRSQILNTQRDEIEDKIEELRLLRQKADYKKYELFDAIDGETKGLVDSVLPQASSMLESTMQRLREIQNQNNYGVMTEDVSELYEKNLQLGIELETLITERIHKIFDATWRWLQRQINELFSFEQGELGSTPSVEPFSFTKAQRHLLGFFDGVDESIGLPEAVVGMSTLGASMAAGGQGMAFLSFLGPLAFPIGGAGGFVVGMFARNYMRVRTMRQHIDQQLRLLESGQELLSSKLQVVIGGVSQSIKQWATDYFDQLFQRVNDMMEEHRRQLSEEGYLETQRLQLEERQQALDDLRDRLLERLESIQSLLQH